MLQKPYSQIINKPSITKTKISQKLNLVGLMIHHLFS